MKSEMLEHFSYTASDRGTQREHNEDFKIDEYLHDGHLIVVADGMGGHAKGDVASKVAASEIVNDFRRSSDLESQARLYRAIQKAHESVVKAASRDPSAYGMGTTVVTCFIQGDEVYVGWVGDSRMYLIREGSITRCTEDHSVVRQASADGGPGAQWQAGHQHIITRAVGRVSKGAADGQFEVDVRKDPVRVQNNNSIVLCSDGLYDLVKDQEIPEIIAGRTAREGVSALIDVANERGGHDNITVSVVNFGHDRAAAARGSAAGVRLVEIEVPAVASDPWSMDAPLASDGSAPATDRWRNLARTLLWAALVVAIVLALGFSALLWDLSLRTTSSPDNDTTDRQTGSQ